MLKKRKYTNLKLKVKFIGQFQLAREIKHLRYWLKGGPKKSLSNKVIYTSKWGVSQKHSSRSSKRSIKNKNVLGALGCLN